MFIGVFNNNLKMYGERMIAPTPHCGSSAVSYINRQNSPFLWILIIINFHAETREDILPHSRMKKFVKFLLLD